MLICHPTSSQTYRTLDALKLPLGTHFVTHFPFFHFPPFPTITLTFSVLQTLKITIARFNIRMSDKRSTLSKLKKSFRIPIRLRRNRHEEAIDALEGPLPPFLQAPPPRADVQVLQKEWQFKERRTDLIEHLDSLYEKAYEFDKPLVDPTAYNKLKIRCETLDLGDDGECENGIDVPNFFVPFPLETLMEHLIVTPDEETKRDYEAHEDIFDRTKNGFESRAPYFRLIWHFECFRRSGIPDGPGRLIDITVWRKQYVPLFV